MVVLENILWLPWHHTSFFYDYLEIVTRVHEKLMNLISELIWFVFQGFFWKRLFFSLTFFAIEKILNYSIKVWQSSTAPIKYKILFYKVSFESFEASEYWKRLIMYFRV